SSAPFVATLVDVTGLVIYFSVALVVLKGTLLYRPGPGSMYGAPITTEAMSMLPTHRPPTHPGEILLKEFLEPLGVSQVEAATRMSIPFQRLNGIVNGRRAVSADTALLLEALTGWDAQIWLTLQAKWDLWHAMRARGNRPKVRPLRKTA